MDAPSDPGAALDALRVIEDEGSRTLAEMRIMVGALRDREDADLAPQNGIADIERLAGSVDDVTKEQDFILAHLAQNPDEQTFYALRTTDGD